MDKKIVKEKSSFLLIHNISKLNNIGLLLQSALTFNVKSIFIINRNKRKKLNTIPGIPSEMIKFAGDRGASKYLNYKIFESFTKFVEFCEKESIFLCGIEIGESSKSLTSDPFHDKTCFILGNEGQGLVGKARKICQGLTYIPHYSNKTASLNVATAGAIVLQRFAEWAEFEEF